MRRSRPVRPGPPPPAFLLAAVLLASTALSYGVGGVGATSAHPVPPAALAGAHVGSRSGPRNGWPGITPTVSVPVSTQYSLALGNDTLFPGNVVHSASPDQAGYVVFDPETQLLLISGSGGIQEVNPSTFAIIASFENSSAVGAMEVLPGAGELLAETSGAVNAYDLSNGTLVLHDLVKTAGSGLDGTLVFIPWSDEVVVGNEYGDELQVLNLSTGNIDATFSMASSFVGLLTATYDPVNGYVYLPNYDNNEIQIINSHGWVWVLNDTLSSTYFGFMMGILANPVTGNVYVTTAFHSSSFGTDYLLQLSGKNASILNATGFGSYTSGMAYDPSTNVLYVGDSANQALYQVNGSTLSKLGAIGIPTMSSYLEGQWWPTFVPELDAVYLGTGYQDTLVGVDAANATVYSSILGRADPTMVADDPACGCYVVADGSGNTLDFFNATTFDLVHRTPMGGASPRDIVYDSWTRQLFVSTESGNPRAIQIFNATTGSYLSSITTYAYPSEGVFDPSNGHLFFTNAFGDSFLDVNGSNGSLNREVHLAANAYPNGIAYASTTGELYISDSGQANVTVVNATNDTTLATLKVGSSPEVSVFDPSSNVVYVAVDGSPNLTAISVGNRTIVGSVSLGYVDGLSVDAAKGLLYVANGSRNLTVLSNLTVVGTVAAGAGTSSVDVVSQGRVLAGDPTTGFVYILSGAPGSFLVNTSLNITPYLLAHGGSTVLRAASAGGSGAFSYAYSGLPAGCTTANSSTLSCTPTGHGQFSVDVRISDATSHTASVQAHLWVLSEYSAWFNETGLPAGTNWTVRIEAGPNLSSTSPSVQFGLINGTYAYQILSGNESYSAAAGSFSVNGKPIQVKVAFRLVTFGITFEASGLPSGATWWLNTSDGKSFHGTQTNFGTTAPNGSFTYVATYPGGRYHAPIGYYRVIGTPVTVYVRFSLVTFNVTLDETNLPTGANWSVQITDTPPVASTTSTVVVPEPNGTYYYTVTPQDHRWRGFQGELNVTGGPVTVHLDFTELLYHVNIATLGLPSGSPWRLDIAGQGTMPPTTNSSLQLLEPNGTYSYTVFAPTGHSARPARGNFTVNGGGVDVSLQFVAYPQITSFRADPPNLTLGNHTDLTVVATGGVAPLRYDYSGLPAGCASLNSSALQCHPTSAGTFTVVVNVTDVLDGTATSNLTLVVEKPSSGNGGTPNGGPPPQRSSPSGSGSPIALYEWAGIGVLAAAAVGAIGLWALRRRGGGHGPIGDPESPGAPEESPDPPAE